MDHEMFDRLARLVSVGKSRRTALAALASFAVLGMHGAADAKSRKAKRRRRGSRVASQAADCFSLGPSSNVSGCDYSGTVQRNRDLSGSTMVGTKFNQADLCGANLQSSNLRNAQFNGAFMFRANLKSSGCRGLQFDSATVLCLTTDCNGNVRNDDCPAEGNQNLLCCNDSHCPPGTVCCERQLSPERAELPRISLGRCLTSCDPVR